MLQSAMTQHRPPIASRAAPSERPTPRATRKTQHAILALTLLAALALRLNGLFWDEGNLFHPDERFVLTVAGQLHWPADGNWQTLDPFWNPETGSIREFAYGHLPLYALRIMQAVLDPWLSLSEPWPAWLTGRLRAVPGDELERLAVIGRALVALADTATVAVLFAIGRRLFGVSTALLASAFLALAVLPIQAAHFFTVDPWATLFSAIAVWGMVRLAARGNRRDTLLAGAAIGLAAACKITMALLILPLVVAMSRARSPSRPLSLAQPLALAAAIFALTNPFALLNLRTFAESMAVQFAVVRGWLDYPYIRQYHGTLPYVYPIVQQWRWGLGPLLTVVAWIGLLWALWRAWRRGSATGEAVILAWVVPFFLLTGAWHAKFPRYLLPIIPFLCLFGAHWLLSLANRNRRALAWAGSALVLAGTFAYALAFANIYSQPHPWLRASAWTYEHVPAGSAIAIEHWDHALPVNLVAGDQVLDHDRYRQTRLEVFDLEDEGRFGELAGQIAQADYVILASRRAYGSLARWPVRYPRTARYYRLLFAERLGFRLVHAEWSEPRLGPLAWREDPIVGAGLPAPGWWQQRAQTGWAWQPGRADESFAVYDHPTPLIFARAETLSAQELRKRLEISDGT